MNYLFIKNIYINNCFKLTIVIAINLRNQINFSPNKWLIGNKDLENK